MGNSKTALITVACQSHGYAEQSADCQELISCSMELLRSDYSVSLTSLLANTRKTRLMLKASSVIPQVPRDVLYGVSSAAFLTFLPLREGLAWILNISNCPKLEGYHKSRQNYFKQKLS